MSVQQKGRHTPAERAAAMPGFDYKFLEKPKRRFQCPLCSKAMREPVQVSTCGHRFCDTCLQEFLRYAACACVRACVCAVGSVHSILEPG